MPRQYHNRIQLYSTANLKYPLDDFSEEDFPFNILVDAAFSVPSALMADMRLTAYVRKPSYTFICVEAGKTPIGHLYVINPEPYKIYPLTMRCQGTAWVVLGPASDQEMELVNLNVPFDPACVLPNPNPANKFRIRVNGAEYPMPNIITVRTNNFMITEDEDRYTDWENPSVDPPVRSLTLRRNDLNLDEKVVRTSLTDIDTEHMPLTSINGVTPDEFGNIDITFTAEENIGAEASTESSSSFHEPEVELVPVVEPNADTNIGFVIVTKNIEGCVDPYIRLGAKIKSGKEGYGLPYDLPLDAYFDSSSSSLSTVSTSSSSSSEAPYSTVSSSSSSTLSSSSSSELPYSTVSSSSSSFSSRSSSWSSSSSSEALYSTVSSSSSSPSSSESSSSSSEAPYSTVSSSSSYSDESSSSSSSSSSSYSDESSSSSSSSSSYSDESSSSSTYSDESSSSSSL